MGTTPPFSTERRRRVAIDRLGVKLRGLATVHPVSSSPPEVKVMYLFAGRRRQSDVASFLQRAHDEGCIKLTLKEYDLELSPDHDLTDLSIWEDIWATLAEGGWTLIVSPPCNTFSRARFHFQDWPGPRPLRNINWPRGFPWLSQHHCAVVEEANLFIDRCIKACLACHASGGKFIIEHPEDLGLVKDERPGSIWQ